MPLSGCLLIIALCILVRRLVLASVAPRTRHLDTQTDTTQHNTQHSLTHTQAQLTRGTLTHTHLNGIEFTFNLIVCFLTFLLVSGSGFISCFLLLFVYLLPLFFCDLRFAFCSAFQFVVASWKVCWFLFIIFCVCGIRQTELISLTDDNELIQNPRSTTRCCHKFLYL